MIGPLYVCILIRCVPFDWCTSGPHTTVYMLVAKNNTTCTTTCLYISLCTHIMCNKAFLFGITLAQLLYASAIAGLQVSFYPTMLSPYGVCEHVLILVHTPLCVYVVQMALYNS